MKFSPILALALLIGLAPAASAQTASESFSGPIFGVYSAMSDIFSCRVYPTRPWCPNPAAHAN